ncbi:MAG: hypothetical protein ACRD9Q_00050, partial [Nitrososphaeraceae archaeon]
FYSGHGITKKLPGSDHNEVGFLIPYDAKPRATGISWATLVEFNEFVKHVNDRISSRQKLFLLDCCFSGIIAKAPDYELQRELSAADMIDAALKNKCVQIFTASNRDEEILANARVNPPISIFTESIARYIEYANPKKFSEGFIAGRIMAKEVKRIVRVASIRLHKSQAPQFYFSPLDQNGEFVFKQFSEKEITDAYLKPDIVYEPLEKMIKESNLLFLFQDQNILAIKRLIEKERGQDYTLLQLYALIMQTVSEIDQVQTELDRLRNEGLKEEKIQEILNYTVNNILCLGIRKGDFEPHLFEVIENKEGNPEVRSKIE